MLPNNLISCWI